MTSQTADRPRFEAIWRQHRHQVLAYCLRRASTADAEDACAETFLVVWRRIDEIPPAPKTLPCLYGIARNQFGAAGFTVQEAVSPITAFGQSGYHLVIEIPPGCVAGDTHNVWEGPNWGERYYQAAGQAVEYWFIDVEGTPVMVEAISSPESSEADVSELRAIVDTLVITP